MTLSWPRLTWPALAARHAAPWSRKISATSSVGRGIAARGYACGSSFSLSTVSSFLGGLLAALLARLRQQVERALDAGDHAGGDAGVTRRRIQLVVSQKRLDDSDIGAALKQVGREAVAQRMQRYALLDPGRLGRLVEQTVQLAGGHWLAAHPAGKQPAFHHRRSGIVARRARFPPLAQQIEHLRRQHDVTVLAALGLFDPNDLLGAVDMLDLQPYHLAGAQAAAIA